MKAIQLTEHGGPERLIWVETPKPAVKSNEVLIKIQAAGINPLDWKLREGIIKDRMSLPFILGCDVAGVIEALGTDVSNFKIGDEVYAMLDMNKGGGYAQYVTADSGLVALKPSSLNYEQAAAVPLAALTAWQALFDEGQLQAGQKVLIQAGSGGVGSYAVQLAKQRDLYVAATTSTNNTGLVKALGADHVIDYMQEDFTQACQGFDMVLDSIGNEAQKQSLKCLKKAGILVTIVNLACEDLAKEYGVTAIHTLVRPNGQRLGLIAKMIDDHKIKPLINSVISPNEIQQAHILSQSGRAKGKIVIKLNECFT